METQELNRISSGNDSSNTPSYKPRKRPKSVALIVHSEHVTTNKQCSRLEKFLILMLSLMLVICLVLLCLYVNERNLTDKLKRTFNETTSPASNYSKYTSQTCRSSNCIKAANDLLRNIDDQVDPCHDFYQYACGKWLQKNSMATQIYRWDQIEKLRFQTNQFMTSIMQNSTTRSEYSTNKAIVKAFMYYESCMDVTEIERLHGSPLKKLLNQYGNWPVIDKQWNESAWDFHSAFIQAHRELASTPFIRVHVDPDVKNSSKNIIYIEHSPLSLSTHGFFSNGTVYKQLRKALKEMMFNLSQVLGGDQTSIHQMNAVFDFEKQLSKISPSKKEDVKKRYRKLTIKELQLKTGNGIKWLLFLQGLFTCKGHSIDESNEIVVFSLEYLQKLTKIIEKAPNRLLSNFMMWRVVKKQYHQLSADYKDIHKNFLNKAFKYSETKTRTNICLDKLKEHFSLPLSRVYSDKKFHKPSKSLIKEIIENLRSMLIENIRQVDWMDDVTKNAAISKAKKVQEKIGYPDGTMDDKLLDSLYYQVQVNSKKYFQNEMNLSKNTIQRGFNKICSPVKEGSWSFHSTDNNAFYSYNFNQMVFPAGLLQPPFYDPAFPRALNYGGIGTIMAHEMTHGFDHTGKNYNSNGDFAQWWTDLSLRKFHSKSQCMVKQYSNYTFHGAKLKGEATLSENIADNGGLKQAFRGYRNWVKKHGEELNLPGTTLTNDQIFFIAFARNWCGHVDPVSSLILMQYSPYPPLPWRVNGTLMNSLDFAKTFNCPPGSPMNPAKKCSVW